MQKKKNQTEKIVCTHEHNWGGRFKKGKKKSDSRRVEWETSKYVKNL